MAFSIVIRTPDIQVGRMLTNRITVLYPNAYVSSPSENSDNSEDYSYENEIGLSDRTVVLYDNLRMKHEPEAENNCLFLPMFSEAGDGLQYIDCSRLKLLIDNINSSYSGESAQSSRSGRDGMITLFLSFVHIEEREAIIAKYVPAISPSDVNVRLDLMSGFRMPSSFRSGLTDGSLTELLRLSAKKRLTPSLLQSMLHPNSLGFLSPGIPDQPDDVFEYGTEACCELISNLRSMICDFGTNMSGIITAEGWRTEEYCRLIRECDMVYVILPESDCDESKNMENTISLFRRSLNQGANLNILYCKEDTSSEYEPAGIQYR